jgi:hypothetical protein
MKVFTSESEQIGRLLAHMDALTHRPPALT